MAKPSGTKIMLVNDEHDTPTKYLTTVPTKGTKSGTKLRLRKYDPAIKKHCWFTQKRLPSPRA
jgi:large subunit ribosomal protein L33